MKPRLLSLLVLCWAPLAIAQDTAKIESIGLFKNGLAVVHVKDVIGSGGVSTLHTLPEPVHGTFWIQSGKPVSAQVTLEDTPVPLRRVHQAQLLGSLKGQMVTLHLDKDTIHGKLLGDDQEAETLWDRRYAPVDGSRSPGYIQLPTPQISLAFIQSENGQVVAVDPNLVRRIEFTGVPQVKMPRPVLKLQGEGGTAVDIDYLTKGISWAPSYRLDLSDGKTLSITQQAVVRNELTDLKDVELRLISGFPSVRYGGVNSPMSPNATWASFFSQLSQGDTSGGSSILMNNVSQQVVYQGRAMTTPDAAMGPADAGEGVDLHYQTIGKRSLAPGESLSLNVATATSEFERVIEWNVPDTRDANGRYLEGYQRNQNADEQFDETAWDAIRFANPFSFPMTSAPAMLVSGGQFQGQQMSFWTNPKDQACIRVNKALSVSTRATEHEIPESRVELRIAGNDFYKALVEGELTVKNFRGRPVVMAIKRRFSGELLSAEAEPKKELMEEGVYSINKRNELSWRVEVPAGAEKVIKYKYEVMVDM